MKNGPLWSLAYEWWFYMLFFPIVTFLKTERQRNCTVFGISLIATICYLVFPYFPIRILMYFGLWWSGVFLASAYLNKNICWRHIRAPVYFLSSIALILSAKAMYHAMTHDSYSIGIHPFNEVRHFLFAAFAIGGGYCWMKLRWVLFDFVTRPLTIFAPVSYMVYISHVPLMQNAHYLPSTSNAYIDWIIYFFIMLATSYLVERVMYPRIRNRIQQPIARWFN